MLLFYQSHQYPKMLKTVALLAVAGLSFATSLEDFADDNLVMHYNQTVTRAPGMKVPMKVPMNSNRTNTVPTPNPRPLLRSPSLGSKNATITKTPVHPKAGVRSNSVPARNSTIPHTPLSPRTPKTGFPHFSNKNSTIPKIPYTSHKINVPSVPHKPNRNATIPRIPYKPNKNANIPRIPHKPNKNVSIPHVPKKNITTPIVPQQNSTLTQLSGLLNETSTTL